MADDDVWVGHVWVGHGVLSVISFHSPAIGVLGMYIFGKVNEGDTKSKKKKVVYIILTQDHATFHHRTVSL